MSTINLISILEKKHLQYRHVSLATANEITFEILKELFIANENRHLLPECAIFLECKNSTKHINNIVKRIFILEESIPVVVASELEIIIEEFSSSNSIGDIDEKLLYLKEELKQIIFRRTGQVHAHINTLDSEISDIKVRQDEENIGGTIRNTEIFLRSLNDRMRNLEETNMSQLRYIQTLEERNSQKIKETMGTLIGALVPTIVEDTIASNGREAEILSSIKSLSSDIRTIKKNLTGGDKSRPQPIRMPEIQQRFTNDNSRQSDDNSGSFF